MQAVASLASVRTTEVADLERKLDVAGDDLMLISNRLDEPQGMFLVNPYKRVLCNVSIARNIVY